MIDSQHEQISYAKTVYGQEEVDAVVKCLSESTQMGNYSRKFEKEIANLFEKKHCLYVNSGSSALFIGVEAFNFADGSEVITPSLTFSTSVGCLIKNNLVPVFIDVEPLTYCIDTNLIEEQITDKTVAILAPNLMGNLCNWKKIREIADRHNLIVIEDSADTLGATLDGKKSGYYSDMSITSFYGSHIINCAGNGGMLCLNDDELQIKSKLLRSWGRSSSIFSEDSEAIENRFNTKIDNIDYDAKFIFEEIGYNLEGSEIGAAFGLVQLEKLNDNINQRIKNFKIQTEYFNKYPEYFITPKQTQSTKTAWLAYPVIISENAKFTRKDFQIYLEKNSIQTRTVFTGNITRQPGFKNINMRRSSPKFLNSDNIMENAVLLACHHGLTSEMISYMHETIDSFIKKYA